MALFGASLSGAEPLGAPKRQNVGKVHGIAPAALSASGAAEPPSQANTLYAIPL
jgi:hypothetical protein